MTKQQSQVDLLTCEFCKLEFPHHLLAPYVTPGATYQQVCPICVRTHRNNLLGLPEGTPFHGTIANDNWQEAMLYLTDQLGKESD